MLLEHQGKRPRIHETAYVAPNPIICGDVTIGEGSGVLFGAVVVAEGGPVEIGASCIVMDNNAVIRGTVRHPEPLNFPRTVFGLERAPAGQTIIPEVTRRYARALGRHRDDRILDRG